ncbi:MAG: hypothetical protein AAGG56_14685 [Pseudomonadota bacterium]
MNFYFALAAALSVFNSALHLFLGGRTIAVPLLTAPGLNDRVRNVQYFCWHIATIALALQAIVFAVAALQPGETSLAIVGTALAGAIGLLGLAIPPLRGISYRTMPQGWLFVPVTVLGLAGLLF